MKIFGGNIAGQGYVEEPQEQCTKSCYYQCMQSFGVSLNKFAAEETRPEVPRSTSVC